MEEASHILESVKDASVALLKKQLKLALEDAHIKVLNQTNTTQVNGSIFEQKGAIMQRFAENVGKDFDKLVSSQGLDEPALGLDYSTLSLVEEDALEGMVSHARNMGIKDYLRFTTRMDAMLYGVRVDESNNPLDPEQLGESFKEAIKPLGLRSQALLIAYRAFNQRVFHNLEQVFAEANRILVEHGVLPELDLSARQREEKQVRRPQQREGSTPEVRAFSDPQQALVNPASLFGTAPAGGDIASGLQPGMLVGGRKVEVLGELQSKIDALMSRGNDAEKAKLFQQELGEALSQTSDESKVAAIDAHSSDVIQLVTMLFDAIWQDRSVPIPVKDLLGRTQISVLKIALLDSTFFDNPVHPARLLLNELATAGISWTDYEKLGDDPMYEALQRTVEAFVELDSSDLEAQQLLLDDFRGQKASIREAARAAEARLRDSEERKKRLDEVNDYARSRIRERILDPDVPQSILDFLDTHFCRFVVKVLLREGPGGVSWKPVMNTIDVLLWTVQSNPDLHDKQRFVRVNPRLLANLSKALSVAGLTEEEAKEALSEVKRIQDAIMSQAGDGQTTSNRQQTRLQASQAQQQICPTTTPICSRCRAIPPVSGWSSWGTLKTRTFAAPWLARSNPSTSLFSSIARASR